MVTPDYIRAHRHASHNREEILRSSICGCFDCLTTFRSSQIKEWIDESFIDGKGQTALCPKCGIDSVIGNESGYPIEKEFLKTMQHHWFGSSGIDLSEE